MTEKGDAAKAGALLEPELIIEAGQGLYRCRGASLSLSHQQVVSTVQDPQDSVKNLTTA